MRAMMFPEEKSVTALTAREQEVLGWVSECKSNWETAQILGCSEGTVKKHLQRIYRKLGVPNRMAAANCLRRAAAQTCSLLLPFLVALTDLSGLADSLGLADYLDWAM